MPQPVPLATSLGMRLNESALHGWDVEVGLDPAAALSDASAALLAEHFGSTMTFLLGFAGIGWALRGNRRDENSPFSSLGQ